MFKIIFLFFLLLYSPSMLANHVVTNSTNCKLECENVNLNNILFLLAKTLKINLIISPSVHGLVTLHLQHTTPMDVFNILIMTYDLARWRTGNTILIMPKYELLMKRQEDIKLKKILQEAEPIVTKVWQIQFAKAEDIAHLLQDSANSFLSKQGQLHVDKRTNQLCVQDTEQSLEQIHFFIKKIDIPVQQVLIQAHLASIDNDYEQQLGIRFASRKDKDVSGLYSLALIKLADSRLLDIQLAAMEKTGHGEVISNPSLFTANQQIASIESGEEIPYQEASASGATNVTFKKAVISLKVMPQIMPDNQVLLHLQVNQDKPSQHIVLGVPSIDTRQIKTSILIKNGQTIVLGGIYENNCEKNSECIPFLGKIPFLGFLFQQQNNIVRKRELLIFVRPIIIGLKNES